MVGAAPLQLLRLLGILHQLVVFVLLHVEEIAVLVVIFEESVFLAVEVLCLDAQVAVIPEVFPAALLEAEFVGAVHDLAAASDPSVVLGHGHHQARVVELLGQTVRQPVEVGHGFPPDMVGGISVHTADNRVLSPVGYSIFIFLIDSLFTVFFVFLVMHFHAHGGVVVVECPETVEEETLAVALGDEDALLVVGLPPAVGLAINNAALARLHAVGVVEYFVVIRI